MTTITEDYAQPSKAGLGVMLNAAMLDNRQTALCIRPGSTLGFVMFCTSDYRTLQLQSRIRHRVAYEAGLEDDPTGAEVWTDFPDWTEPSGTTPTVPAALVGGSGGTRAATGTVIEFDYDDEDYDMHEIEVRARVYNADDDTASEWRYDIVKVVFMPELVAYDATLDANGELAVEFVTNWPRSAPRFYMADGSRFISVDIPTFTVPAKLLDANGRFTAPKAYFSPDDNRAVAMNGDGVALLEEDGLYVLEPGIHVDPDDVPDPVVEVVSASTGETFVKVTCLCEDVRALAAYEDNRGERQVVELDVTGGMQVWTASLGFPPLGVPIEITVSCCNESMEYKSDTVTVTVEGGSHCMLDGHGDHVELLYDGEYGSDTDLAGEHIQLAGRPLPVSRHGDSVERGITVSGRILYPGVFAGIGDMDPTMLEVLDSHHDWIYRNPRGVRKNVMVTSWSFDADTEGLGRYGTVQIEMVEVG